MVNSAKAILLSEGISTNTQAGIINQFDETFIDTNKIQLQSSFKDLVYQIKKNEPTAQFAKTYINQAIAFFDTIETYRAKELKHAG
jgi:sulfite reductase (ferredoxin)